jgi:RNA polymerase sigma-70 factor (ECF subfamily)
MDGMTILDVSHTIGRFEKLYRKHYARVWRYFHANRISDDEAHDLAQDTFKRVFERMDQIRNEEEWPFIAAVARTILLNRVRARQTQKRSAKMITIDDPDLPFEIAAPSEADPVEAKQQTALLTAALSRLSHSQRECLRLRLAGSSYDEISKILGVTLDAVKSRLRDALRSLRDQLGAKR